MSIRRTMVKDRSVTFNKKESRREKKLASHAEKLLDDAPPREEEQWINGTAGVDGPVQSVGGATEAPNPESRSSLPCP